MRGKASRPSVIAIESRHIAIERQVNRVARLQSVPLIFASTFPSSQLKSRNVGVGVGVK
jgi:hypothetical protein